MHNFRKRAENRGYISISIRFVEIDNNQNIYYAEAYEPFAGCCVGLKADEEYFDTLFRKGSAKDAKKV